jgi:hypothetical protein
MFPTQYDVTQECASSPMILTLEYTTIRKVQENQVVLKLNGTHQLLVHADDVESTGRQHKYHKEKHRSEH